MYDLTIADVNSYMPGITDNITRLCLCQTVHLISYKSVPVRGMRQVHTKVFINTHDKTGTVCSICQAGTAIYIRISHELKCKIHHCLSYTA